MQNTNREGINNRLSSISSSSPNAQDLINSSIPEYSNQEIIDNNISKVCKGKVRRTNG